MNWDAIVIALDEHINDRLVAEAKFTESINGFRGYSLGQDVVSLISERQRCRVARDFAQLLRDMVTIGRLP